MGYVNNTLRHTIYLLASGSGSLRERAEYAYWQGFTSIGLRSKQIPEEFQQNYQAIGDVLGNKEAGDAQLRQAIEMLVTLYHDLPNIPDVNG